MEGEMYSDRKTFRTVVSICALATAVVCLSTFNVTSLYAQATATILGTVMDPSGATIGGAMVQVKNTGTSITQTAVSDEQGRYRFPDLAIGEYEVQASQPGFQTVVRKDIALTVGSTPVVDFRLPVGQTTEAVTVAADVSQVETQSTGFGTLVESKQMTELPLNGRNFTQLITLAPGVTQIPTGAPGAGSTFYGNGQKYSIAGARPSGQAYLLDDQDMVNFWNNGPGAGGLGTALGVEAIAEFQALTNTYTSQFGGNGAVINASSRSGTNNLHGSVYEFLRNDKLEARNFFDTVIKPGHTTAEPPTFRQNQFGLSVGGPIKKDKVFFFGNYEGLRRTQIITNVVTVPDACAHQFLTTLASGVCGAPVNENANPQVRQTVRNVMALYPMPNYVPELFAATGAASATGQAVVNDPNIGDQNYILGRIDYNVSEKSSIFFRYVMDRANRDFTTNIPYWPEIDRSRDHFVAFEERHVLSSKLVNSFHIGFSRPYEDAYVYGSPVVANGVASPGTIASPVTSGGTSAGTHPLQFFSSDPTSQFYAVSTAGQGIPRQDGSVNPGSGITTIAASATLPFYLVPNKLSIGDDLVRTSGAHSLKIGGRATKLSENTWAPFQVAPQWTFANLTSFMQGNAATLNGQVSDAQNPGADSTKDYRYWVFSMYVDDQWKLTRKLTLNIGLRYEPTTIIKSIRHQQFNLVNAPFGQWVPTTQSTATNPSLHNIDPRIGIAWDPFSDHKTSIRAGFGVFHSVLYSRDTNHWLQPPFLTVAQSTTSNPPIQFPFPFTNVPQSTGTVIPTDGTLSCTNCDYYGRDTTPSQMQWNLNIQHEVLANTVATIGYIGSHSVHLPAQKDFNTPVPFIGPSGRPTFGVLTGANVVANPRLNPAYSYLQMMDALADAHYHALQTGLNHRFSSGWQSQITYTWSKSIDNSSGSYGLDGGGNIYNPTDTHADRGLSNFDRRHNFRVSGIYDVPFKAAGILGGVISGWRLTSGYGYLSGSPFSVGTIANRVHNSLGANAARPDAKAGCDLYTGYRQLHGIWFNPNCFVPAPFGTYGNAGRDTITGPNLWNVDSSLSKDWKVPRISEQFRIQFRAEAFNILNHPSFQNPSGSVFNANLAAANPTDPTSGVSPNGSVGRITATNSSPRQIQLALKIVF
jgi:hypothetical protein